MGWVSNRVGGWLAGYLTKEVGVYVEFSVQSPDILREHLQPGDVLLVEGSERISVAIKYLTQSTWSHAALYVGRALGVDQPDLIEADLEKGVIAVPLEKYSNQNTRICRPVGISPQDRAHLIDFAVAHIGDTYDLKNVLDLARYLLPTPPVPQRWRRKLLSVGSGDPTRAICSTLIAEAFQSVGYPVLPKIVDDQKGTETSGGSAAWTVRHHSLFTPRDFDLSPYFATIKPTIEDGFDYKAFNWSEEP
jgi:hypothetical protein